MFIRSTTPKRVNLTEYNLLKFGKKPINSRRSIRSIKRRKFPIYKDFQKENHITATLNGQVIRLSPDLSKSYNAKQVLNKPFKLPRHIFHVSSHL